MNFKAYCFDIDGTVLKGKTGIPSAVTFIHHLQSNGIEPIYVTNNSSKTAEQLQALLNSIGVDAPISHIYSSALATAKYVAQHFDHHAVHVIGSDGILDAVKRQGLSTTAEAPQALIMGIDRAITYERLTEAAYIVQAGAALIATNGDIKFPTERGFAPGNGSLVNLVANVAGVTPVVIGKPSPVMLEIVAKEHGVTVDEMVMIGDNYDTDILCGINYGCATIHVNTGVTPTEIAKTKEQRPTYFVNELTELI